MKDLHGARILLTRSARGCRRWARQIEACNGRPVLLPCIRTETLHQPELPDRLARALAHAQWMTLSSRTGVEALARQPVVLPESVAIGVVGPATAAAARAHFGRVDLLATDGTAGGLADAIAARLEAPRAEVLVTTPATDGTGTDLATAPRPATAGSVDAAGHVVTIAALDGSDDLERKLRARGIHVDRIELYRTVWQPSPEEHPPEAIHADVVLLASPSAARGLLARVEPPDNAQIITIGPTTTAAARQLGLEVSAEAKHRSLEAMLEQIR